MVRKIRLLCLALILFGVSGLGFVIYGMGITDISSHLSSIYFFASFAVAGCVFMSMSGIAEIISIIRERAGKNEKP